MTSLVTRRPAHVRRLGAAALLAATALLGTTTGTLADPATACAKPPRPGFDRSGYVRCAESYLDAYEEDPSFSLGELDQAIEWCCNQFGGDWYEDLEGGGECLDPAELDDEDVERELPRFPDLGDVTATLTPAPPPPAGPIAPLPPVEATLAPTG